MAKRHVIVGGGPAGLCALETLRQLDPEAQITLVSDERPYSRMVLPYYMAGEIPEDHVYTASDGSWTRLRVAARERRAVAIDTGRKRVELSDGSTLPYDCVLLATGSTPIHPDVPGAGGDRVHHLWTLTDAHRTVKAIRGRQARVVFIGAGFIGLIVLNALAKAGCALTVVELEPQILPRMLDRDAAELARRWLEGRGVAVHTGARAEEIADSGPDKVVRLSNGTRLRADVVVLGIGVRPNVEALTGSGIRVDQGIVVNEYLETSAPGVYAAGDCAQGPDLSTGERAVHAIQPTAVEHGRVAGANMAGQRVRYPGSLGMNVLDVVGLQCASFGLWRGDGRETSVVATAGRSLYRKLVWDGDRVVGAILLGHAEDVGLLNDLGMVKGLIQARVPLGPWAAELRRDPMDVRRAFVGAGAPAALLDRVLLGRPAEERGYRFRDARPGPATPRVGEVPVQLKLDPTRGGRFA